VTDKSGKAFWEEMANLAASRHIAIDRPQGSAHPRYPDLIYPFDYGYLQGTSAADGDGIDGWIGSQEKRALTGILCSYDTFKCDAEIKLLLGCTESDVQIILQFNGSYMCYLYIPRLMEDK
jgi:inorganic pyrophosphatase